MDIAGKPVQPGDHQNCLLLPAKPKGFGECRPIVSLSILDFHNLAQKRPVAAVETRRNRHTLRGNLPNQGA